jgi:hypothetical protein
MTDDGFRARMAARDALEALPAEERRGDDADRHAPAWFESLPADVVGPLEARKPWPIGRECDPRYRAIRSSGRRPLASIGLLVVHCTQGATAAGAARWFTNPACRGSAHVVVDGIECFRTLAPSMIPWGAPGVNGRGWHLEIAGFAEWSRAEWLYHAGTLDRAAYKLAWHGRAFRIPIVRLTDAELRGGRRRGVVDHAQASRVYGGTHTDVGRNFPWPEFLDRARRHSRAIGAK